MTAVYDTSGVRNPMSLRASWAWFTMAMLVFVPLLGLYASGAHGTAGWQAAAWAGALCWGAGLSALAIMARSRGPNAVSGMLLAMLVRLGVPMAVCIAVDSLGGSLKDAGFFQLVVWTYLATLAVETWLMARMIPASQSGAPKATSPANSGEAPVAGA